MASSFELLVASMKQDDFSLIQKMNLCFDTVIANQTDKEEFSSVQIGDHVVKMISTTTKGVGINRNLTIEFSTADIVLFGDEDMYYYDGLEQTVSDAFKTYPKADVMIFGLDYSIGGVKYASKIPSGGRLPIVRSFKYGCVFAVRRSAIMKKDLRFSELLGGGSIYSHGEDSDFLLKCYKNKLSVYTYPKSICVTAKDVSTWNEGLTEKYYYDAGAFAKKSMGVFAFAYIVYISFRLKSEQISFLKRIVLLLKGYKGFSYLFPYQQRENKVFEVQRKI